MPEFSSWESYWRFARAVTKEARYVHTGEVREFLAAVESTSHSRQRTISESTTLWRGQIGSDWEIRRDQEGEIIGEDEWPFGEERMKPIPGKARENRANPKGIAHLYAAMDQETAMAELRPWLRTSISLGKFHTSRDLRTIDISNEGEPRFYLAFEPSPEEREKTAWALINRAFSLPVTNSDESTDYVPTQVLAELFKSIGFDGIVYKSSCTDGVNVVLFDLESAMLEACALFELTKLTLWFSQTGNWCIEGKRPKAKRRRARRQPPG